MSTVMKLFGWLLAVPGGIFLVTSPMPWFNEGNTSATFGLILMGLMLALPGGLLLRGAYTRERDQKLQEQMAGFVRSRDAFTIDELAHHIGKTPAEAQSMLTRDIAVYHLPLVLHRASNLYMRLDRLDRAAQVAERCQSCGGALGQQVVFAGERLSCPYCGVAVATHAANSGTWQAQQGPWGLPQQPGTYQAAPQQRVQPQHQHYQQGGPWGQQ